MGLSGRQMDFVRRHPSAAMMTQGRDGWAKAARVSVGIVDGRLLSSGTADRVRTRRLRRDPRCTLLVFDGTWRWLGIEATVRLVEGDGSAELNLRLAREIQKRPAGPLAWLDGDLDDEAFLAEMVRDNRLVYELDVERAYGEI